MIGIDTSFLVAFEDSSHQLHPAARSVAERYAAETFALAPQVLTEFVHVVTDPRRFEHPLTMNEALERASKWWDAREKPSREMNSMSADFLDTNVLIYSFDSDALIIAGALEASCKRLLTEDLQDGRVVRGLEIVNPFAG